MRIALSPKRRASSRPRRRRAQCRHPAPDRRSVHPPVAAPDEAVEAEALDDVVDEGASRPPSSRPARHGRRRRICRHSAAGQGGHGRANERLPSRWNAVMVDTNCPYGSGGRGRRRRGLRGRAQRSKVRSSDRGGLFREEVGAGKIIGLGGAAKALLPSGSRSALGHCRRYRRRPTGSSRRRCLLKRRHERGLRPDVVGGDADSWERVGDADPRALPRKPRRKGAVQSARRRATDRRRSG